MPMSMFAPTFATTLAPMLAPVFTSVFATTLAPMLASVFTSMFASIPASTLASVFTPGRRSANYYQAAVIFIAAQEDAVPEARLTSCTTLATLSVTLSVTLSNGAVTDILQTAVAPSSERVPTQLIGAGQQSTVRGPCSTSSPLPPPLYRRAEAAQFGVTAATATRRRPRADGTPWRDEQATRGQGPSVEGGKGHDTHDGPLERAAPGRPLDGRFLGGAAKAPALPQAEPADAPRAANERAAGARPQGLRVQPTAYDG